MLPLLNTNTMLCCAVPGGQGALEAEAAELADAFWKELLMQSWRVRGRFCADLGVLFAPSTGAWRAASTQ